MTDPACMTAGSFCSDNNVVVCMADAGGCLFQASSSACVGRQSCAWAAATATCACAPDPTCSTAGAVCATSSSVATCGADMQGCLAQTATRSCTGDDVCERLAPGCADSFWGEWPLPSDIGPTAYVDNGDETVTDSVTKLMWQKATAPSQMDWATAKSYCQTTLHLGGHSDWRLPAKIELLSLVDYGRTAPAINSTFFPSTQAMAYWSATPRVASSSAWSVTFDIGNALSTPLTALEFVRCVR